MRCTIEKLARIEKVFLTSESVHRSVSECDSLDLTVLELVRLRLQFEAALTSSPTL